MLLRPVLPDDESVNIPSCFRGIFVVSSSYKGIGAGDVRRKVGICHAEGVKLSGARKGATAGGGILEKPA